VSPYRNGTHGLFMQVKTVDGISYVDATLVAAVMSCMMSANNDHEPRAPDFEGCYIYLANRQSFKVHEPPKAIIERVEEVLRGGPPKNGSLAQVLEGMDGR
jgi:hypothetical protein